MDKSTIKMAGLVVVALLVGFVWGNSRHAGETTRRQDNAAMASTEPMARPRSQSSGLPQVPTISASAIFEGKQSLQDRLNDILRAPVNQRKMVHLQALLMELPSSDYPLVLQMLSDQTARHGSQGGYQRWMLSQALEIMAEKDPGLVIAFADQTPNENRRRQYLQSALGGWAITDPEAARQWFDQLEAGPLKQQLVHPLVTSMAQTSLDEALELVDTHLKGSQALNAKMNLFSELASSHPEEAAARLASLPASSRNQYVYQQIASGWAAKDTGKALAWARAIEHPQSRHMALSGIAQNLSLNETDTFQPLMDGISNHAQKQNVLSNFTRHNAEEDLQGTLDWIADLEDPKMQSQAYASVHHVWAQQDREGALAHLDQIQSGREKTQMIQSIARQWANEDPDGALEWVHGLPPGRARRSAYENLGRQLANTDPKMAMAMAEQMPPGQAKQQVVRQVMNQLSRTNPEEAMQMAMDLPNGRGRTDAIRDIAYQLAESDPKQAIALADTLPNNQNKQNMLGQIANAWAMQDVNGALEWAESLDNDQARQNALTRVAERWVESNPEEAMRYASDLKDPDIKASVMRSMSQNLSRHDAEAAATWVESMEDPALKKSLLPNVMSQWAGESPLEAAEYVASMEAGDIQNKAAIQVASQWANYEPAYAVEWASGFEDQDTQQQANAQIIQKWADQDEEAAGAWLLQQPQDKGRDQLIQTYAQSIGNRNPEMGVIWANGISDETMRRQTVEQYAQDWLRNDQEKAVAWLQQSDLPPETLLRLLEPKASSPAQSTQRPAPSPQMDLEMMRRYGLIPAE